MWAILKTLVFIFYYEIMHGLWAVLWCLPLLAVFYLTSITQLRVYWEFLTEDSFTRILLLVAIILLVLGLSWQSHAFADVYGLGF